MKLQAAQDSNAYEMNEDAAISRAVSKSSKIYSNTSWDLVDAKKEKGFDYSKIDKSTLPKNLKNKNTQELKKYVEKKSRERSDIQNQIQKVNIQRNKYLAKHKKSNTDDELENVMLNAIKNQAKKKNYTW